MNGVENEFEEERPRKRNEGNETSRRGIFLAGRYFSFLTRCRQSQGVGCVVYKSNVEAAARDIRPVPLKGATRCSSLRGPS